MKRKKLHLVFATDAGFLLPTTVSVASAVAHASEPSRLIVNILDCGISKKGWSQFVSCVRQIFPVDIVRYRIDLSRYANFKAYRGNLCVYARLEIPRLIDEADWCAYVDGDTLFLADPLGLLELCDDNYALLGHKDMGDDPEHKAWFLRNKLPWHPDDYVCAGFVLMNLKWMRENDISTRCMEFLDVHPDTPLNDQDVLNIFCSERRSLLPFEWGTFNIESFENGRIPKCVHYAFGKPWNLGVKWTRCLLDVDRLWFLMAKRYCKIGFLDAGASCGAYFKRWLRSIGHRVFLAIVCLTVAGRNRWGAQRRYYSPVPVWKLM